MTKGLLLLKMSIMPELMTRMTIILIFSDSGHRDDDGAPHNRIMITMMRTKMMITTTTIMTAVAVIDGN